ncbi:hypothetical protein ACH47B_01905 [Rhodococcus sp. NPDC019627]
MREAAALLQYGRAGRAMIALLEMTALSLSRPTTDALVEVPMDTSESV